MRRLSIPSLAVMLMVWLIPVQALAAPPESKTVVCHVQGNGTFIPIEVAKKAVPAHLDHGDGLIGGDVPGMAGYSFDGNCIPQSERILARAWSVPPSSCTNSPEFTIAEFVDKTGDGATVGDEIRMGFLPWHFSDCSAGEFNPLDPLVVTEVQVATSTEVSVMVGEASFSFMHYEGMFERYSESYEWPIHTIFSDGLVDTFFKDVIFVWPGSPGNPDTDVPFGIYRTDPADNGFVNVAIFWPYA